MLQDYECQIRSLQEQVEKHSIMTESLMSSAALTSSHYNEDEDYLGKLSTTFSNY